jgi:uncharacterized protein (DUF2384 family)
MRVMKFRKSGADRLDPASARRQGQATTLAFCVLGRDAAIAFLNSEHAGLGGRPIDLVVSSAEGCALVEAELERMAPQPATG